MFSAAHHRKAKHSTWVRSLTTGVATGLAVGAVFTLVGFVSPGSPAHADSSSAVTVTAASQDTDIADAPLPDLSVTVSQTRDLQAQGIQLDWTGGLKSNVPDAQTGGSNFLQIMQCWGDDPDNPGQPDRTTCQYGGFASPGATRDANVADGFVSPNDTDYTVPGSGFASPTYTSIPFRSATGVTVASVVKSQKVPGVDVNTNQFFTRLTTNEIPWAGSSSTGVGSAKFEIQTAAQSPGLGCGAPITAADGTVSGAGCWLVIIPRGTSDAGTSNIINPGLLWDSWKHRIAIRLGFQPIGVRCALGAAERQLAGSELIAGAVESWQPALCSAAGGAAYTLIGQNESDAALAANTKVAAPLALTSRPLSTDGVTDKLEYAPVALTGMAISFAVDRSPNTLEDLPDGVADRARQPFTQLKLTPLLVAKLLTNSYLDSLPNGSDKSELLANPSKGKTKDNPRTITQDPDFLAVNDPEWAYQNIVSPSVADLLEPQGRSDGAWALWSYVLSDKDAVSFLAGNADKYGMIVNPYSATDAAKNTTGTAFQVPRDNFPKADPIVTPKDASGRGPINLVTWRPYTNDLDTSAYLTLRGDGQILGDWNPNAATPSYGKSTRSLPGLQSVLAITDFASAQKYQVFTASLENAAGAFVSPSSTSLTAAAAAMTPSASQATVLGYDPTSSAAKAAPTAYPLTMPVYAAVNPAMQDTDSATAGTLRQDYANFIRYAVSTGQQSGTGLGQLPDGYAPIPQSWKTQALAAAAIIQNGPTPVATPTPTPAAPQAAANAGAGTGSVPPSQTAGLTGSVPAAAVGTSPQETTTPAVTGASAAPLLGAPTPADPSPGLTGIAVPASIFAGLAAAFAVPATTRIRRRL